MTDQAHIDEFAEELTEPLEKALVEAFIVGHRDPLVKEMDLVIRLKELMERALWDEDADP